MANEEVLGPRKTMFVLVVVVGCFAVLWPRILSPLIVGHTREQLKPNQFDREAGCCEVMFETDIAVLELINEVCSSAVHADGKLSPYAGAECRKAVNETCGVDIAAFLKRSDNVGKTSKLLIKTMQSSNSSCLKEHFGVPTWSLNPHLVHSWAQDTVKQERSPIRAGPHPALRERGRAIPPGAPTPPSRVPVPLPPHVRVRSSPLSVYFELDAKPPPIPGMRPPLGSPGGPVPAPKSSMGFVMPIYTICIIVFFVYTLSKILFKRTGPSLYDPVAPDPQFRRRVFRDDSRASPDKLVVTAISGLVAEVQQQMEASYGQNQQRQDVQDNHTRPYTNGTILHNSGPVHIVASEYREISKERSPEPLKEEEEPDPNAKECTPEPEETAPKQEEEELVSKTKECTPEPEEPATKQEEPTPEPNEPMQVTEELDTKPIEVSLRENEAEEVIPEDKKSAEIEEEPKHISDTEEPSEDIIELPKEESIDTNHVEIDDLLKLTGDIGLEKNKDGHKRLTEEFLREESNVAEREPKSEEKLSTQELLEEAIQDSQDDRDEERDTLEPENASVKVLGMELTAHSADGGAWVKSEPVPQLPAQPGPAPPPPRPHEAEEVKSIFLETEIPQKSRVLVADFAEDRTERPAPTKHSPMVVSGKMTLSLIQDAPRETPERDSESTVDDFTTASAVTQNAAEKEDDLSDEEIEEEIEIEEIEEELEDEEEEEEEPKDKKHVGTKK